MRSYASVCCSVILALLATSPAWAAGSISLQVDCGMRRDSSSMCTRPCR